MQVDRFEVPITVDASGNGTGFTPIGTGQVLAIRYVPDGTSPYLTGAVVTVTGDVSGLPVLTVNPLGTVAAQYYPRAATVSPANAANLYAAAGTAVIDRIPTAAERIKIVLSAAGVSTTGKFHVWIG